MLLNIRVLDKYNQTILAKMKMKTAKRCQQCDFTSFHSSNVSRHTKSKHEDLRWMCQEEPEICQYEARWETDLKVHKLRKHGRGMVELSCNQCTYKAVHMSIITRHVDQVHKKKYKKNLQCNQCTERLSSNRNLEDHIKYQHKGEKRIKKKRSVPCTQCPQTLSSNEGLKQHVKYLNKLEKRPPPPIPACLRQRSSCDECGKSLSSSSALQSHINHIHLKIKRKKQKYVKTPCGQCPKVFASRSSMRRHDRYVHEGVVRPRPLPRPLVSQ